jgi:hypothetical protein
LDPSSDHTPVFISLDSLPYSRPNKTYLTNGSTNWIKFRKIIDQKINLNINLKTPNEIDDAVQNFTDFIQSVAWNSTTLHSYHKNYFSIPTHIRELITLKRRARARWQRSRLPSDKNIFNNLASTLKNILNKLKNDSFHNWATSLSVKNGSLWRATRNCLKQKNTQSPLKMPLVIGVRPIKSKPTPFSHTSLKTSNHTASLAITFLKKILKTLSLLLYHFISPPNHFLQVKLITVLNISS